MRIHNKIGNAFKMGMMTMVVLTILLLVAKTVFLTKLLLVINLGFVLAKLILWKKDEHHHSHHGWSPDRIGGGGGGGSGNDIHLHIHNPAPEIVYPSHSYHNDLPYGAHAQRSGPSIHIEPASSYGVVGGGGGDSWGGIGGGGGGYIQRRQQSGNGGDYAYADNPPPQSPVYIPNTRYN